MQHLSGDQEKRALGYIDQAVEVARQATCQRSKCGSVVVAGDQIIGRGFNSPVGEIEEQRRCTNSKDSYDKKVTDKTCCLHAEQRAIINALKNNPEKLPGSSLYFIRLDAKDEPVRADQPYCTICSKMALDVGVAEFILWHEEGVCVYDTAEYNTLSYQFNK